MTRLWHECGYVLVQITAFLGCVETSDSIIAGVNEMDVLRISYVTNPEHSLASPHQRFQEVGSNILTVYCSWRKSAISTATYLFVIASVAIYDILLTIQYRESLAELEENPIGRWLMNLDQVDQFAVPDLTLFLMLKSIGTIIVLITVYALVKRRGRIGHPIAAGVTTFQLVLATYLTFSANGSY